MILQLKTGVHVCQFILWCWTSCITLSWICCDIQQESCKKHKAFYYITGLQNYIFLWSHSVYKIGRIYSRLGCYFKITPPPLFIELLYNTKPVLLWKCHGTLLIISSSVERSFADITWIEDAGYPRKQWCVSSFDF